jgi:diacylglycerol O-acyltransferase / wax synthase
MHRMSGIDALFLYDETPNEPQHTIKLAIVDDHEYSFAAAKEGVRARLAELAPLRWRAVRVPFDLHHPVWVEQGSVDLDHHVRRLAVPAPGGRRELCEVVSEIAGMALDPTRPPWELWLLEGYEQRKIVAVVKISHALADGESTRELLERALSPHPISREAFASRRIGATTEAPPRQLRLLADAMRDLRRDLFVRLPRLIRGFYRARGERHAQKKDDARPPNPFRAPRHAFGGRLGRRRAFCFTTVALAQAREVKSRFGVTITDVVLATVAGAARRYLARNEDLPAAPILGSLAASIRTESQRGTFGNRVTTRFLRLPTHLADPAERLLASHAQAAIAKRHVAASRGLHLEEWIAVLPPVLVKRLGPAMRWIGRMTRVSGGVIVSSVAGPRKPLYAGPAAIENFVSVGHMKYVAGLNVTVWSYADKLNFAIYACRDAVPDAWPIAEAIDEAFAELVAAADLRRAQAA